MRLVSIRTRRPSREDCPEFNEVLADDEVTIRETVHTMQATRALKERIEGDRVELAADGLDIDGAESASATTAHACSWCSLRTRPPIEES
jgi:hypothetical protein